MLDFKNIRDRAIMYYYELSAGGSDVSLEEVTYDEEGNIQLDEEGYHELDED